MADEFNIPKKQIPYFVNTLPLTYNASISYYEQVGQLVYKINELIDAMNSYAKDYKSYTDEQIALLKKYVDSQINEVYAYADKININLTNLIGITADNLKADYISKINQLNNSLNSRITQEVFTINNRITSEVITLNTRISLEVQNLKDYIDSQLIDIKVIDPTTGLISDLQTTLNNIVNLMKGDALTAEQYDALNLTAQTYDNKKLTAYQYDFNGKSLLTM
ncbi:MAG: hypothetical protein ACLUV3_13190 [Oscillospiraceae bacterium]